MSKIKLFGNNIDVSCDYCANSKVNNGVQFCTMNKVLKNGKCRKFVYNPIMRVPKTQNNLRKYNAEEFVL